MAKLDVQKYIRIAGKRVKNKHIGELIREIGLHSLVCPSCGKRMDATRPVRDLFELILTTCKNGAKTGVGVTICGLGMFRARRSKSRLIKTPLNGIVRSKGGYALKFKPSVAAKKKMNE